MQNFCQILTSLRSTCSKKTATSVDDDISSFIEQNRNVNTTKKKKTDLNVWKRWCQSIKETRFLEDISPEELNNVSGHFFIKVRKINIEEFEPGTPTSFQRFRQWTRCMIRSFDEQEVECKSSLYVSFSPFVLFMICSNQYTRPFDIIRRQIEGQSLSLKLKLDNAVFCV